MKLQGSHDN
ncbi:Protein of unknown function [Bacillus mycoides]|nr:Protein of unknown function [Bacillus mycoides]